MKNLIVLFFCLFTYFSNAQNFYEIKWEGSDGIKYTALLEFFAQDNINVRVKYTSTSGIYKVAKYRCTGKYVTDDSGEKYYVLDGANSELVYPAGATGSYSADNFVFTNINSEGKYEEIYTFDDNDENLENLVKASFKKLDPAVDFTEQYIYNFYERNEPEYASHIALIANNQSTADHFKIKLKNSCSKTIRAFIRYKTVEGEWETKGWWTIEPGKTAYVEDSRNSIFYFYAEAKDKSLFWKGEDNFKEFQGTEYGLRQIKKSNLEYGEWVTNISCSNVQDDSGQDDDVVVENVKLHLVFVADTEDPNIGSSVGQDMNDITNLFKKATRELGMKYEEHKLYSNSFDKASIVNEVNSMSVAKNDVVIFYYSGHGYNQATFPEMSLDGVDYGLQEMHNLMKQKGARLTLTIGDLCNSIPQTRSGTKSNEEIPFKSGFLFDSDKLKKLFIYSKGNLISTSSEKGQWSYCMRNPNQTLGNGHFTNAFINSFTVEASKVSNESGSWEELFDRAYTEAKN